MRANLLPIGRSSSGNRVAPLVAALGLLAATGCGSKPCKDGTILLTVNLAGAAAGADTLALSVAIDGGAAKASTATLGAGVSSGTVEITFPAGYPTGKSVSVAVTARKAGADLATRSGAVTLAAACGSLTVDLGGSSDGGSDGGMCVPKSDACTGVACGQVDDGCGGMADCGPCQLLAVRPEVATAGQTVYLEGRFAAATTVLFPGGASATAVVLGPSRATAVVPATAGVGLVQVTSGGTTTASLPFRRASYTIGLDQFRVGYEQTATGRAPSGQTLGGWGGVAVTSPSRVWIAGGVSTGETATNVVQEARIDGDGSIGGFANLAGTLVTARIFATAERVGSTVFVLGGRNPANAAETTIEQATIAADGSLGPFTVSTRALVTGRFNHASAVIGSYLYVFGGDGGTRCSPTALASIERAPIAADGTLGAFTDAGVSLTATREKPAVAVVGTRVYVIAGAQSATIDSAPILPDGTLGPFANAGALPAARSAALALCTGDQLFVIGGFFASDILVAPVHADDTLGAFTTSTSRLAAQASYAPTALVGGSVYLFGGGFTMCCSACAAGSSGPPMQRASLDASGNLQAFAAEPGVALRSPRNNFGLIALGNWVYVIGGALGTGSPADVERAPINPDGTLGTFAAATSRLVTPRASTAVAVIGNRVYVVGGQDTARTALRSVEVATVAPDGTLGNFAVAMAPVHGAVVLPADRPFASLVVVGRKVCVLATAQPVLCSPIQADASLGSDFADESTYTVGSTENGPPILLDTNLYWAGGMGGGVDSATVSFSTGLTSTFSTVTGLNFPPAAGPAIFTVGDALYVTGGFTGLSTDGHVGRAPILADGTLTSSVSQTPGLVVPHSSHRAIVIGNRAYVIGGNNDDGNMPASESATLK